MDHFRDHLCVFFDLEGTAKYENYHAFVTVVASRFRVVRGELRNGLLAPLHGSIQWTATLRRVEA